MIPYINSRKQEYFFNCNSLIVVGITIAKILGNQDISITALLLKMDYYIIKFDPAYVLRIAGRFINFSEHGVDKLINQKIIRQKIIFTSFCRFFTNVNRLTKNN